MVALPRTCFYDERIHEAGNRNRKQMVAGSSSSLLQTERIGGFGQ